MDAENDPIKSLLQSTGLSCEDLLQKLLQYKNQQNKVTEKTEEVHHEAADAPNPNGQNGSNDTTANDDKVVDQERHDSIANERLIINATNDKQESDIAETSTATEKLPEVLENQEEVTRSSVRDGFKELEEISKGDESTKPVTEEREDREVSKEITTQQTTGKLPQDLEHQEEMTRSSLREGFKELKEISESNKPDSKKGDKIKDSKENTIQQTTEKLPEVLDHQEVVTRSGLKNGFEELEEISESDKSKEPNIHKKEEIQISLNHEETPTLPENDIIKDNKDSSTKLTDFHIETPENCPSKDLNTTPETKIQEKTIYEPEHKNDTKENDIEVCQIEDLEGPPPMPLLKLRTDLFANNSQGNFTLSDNEDDNDESNPEIKEFLKNVEEVTAEVQSTIRSVRANDTEDIPKVRKVKMGFVKKRIVNKAIRCLNDVESKKLELIKKNELFVLPPPEKLSSQTSEEEVRESLKLQLCTLRNRKKKTELFKNKHEIKTSPMIYDKKKAPENSKIVDPTMEKHQTEFSTPSEDATIDKNETNSKEPLFSQSTESGFMIVDVQGGSTETNHPEEKKEQESLFSLSTETDFLILDVKGGVDLTVVDENAEKTTSDAIKLTKTKDVTKIKGWQNKKFQICEDVSEKSETKDADDCDKPEESCNETMEVEKNLRDEKIEVKEELSPFVSNSLEEFLTENSTLNISYNIPKLGAEEALNMEKYNTVIKPQTDIKTYETDKKEDNGKPRSIKPKTLAEKRRMLESSKRKIENVEAEFNKSSYVIYNGKKIHVPTTISEKCLGYIKFNPKSHKQIRTTHALDTNDQAKKMKLLDIYLKNNNPASYKSGPLSEKHRLQDKKSSSEWITETRRLPKVKLNLIPVVGKPVHPQLRHLFNFGPIIQNDRLELALSAFVEKKDVKPQGFRLTVPYANKQKYILVRKRKNVAPNVTYDISPEKNSVKSVLDDVISYVENKDYESKCIKDAEVYNDDSVVEKVNYSNDTGPVRKPKRRKLDSELLRLSCKVVSVSVDETEDVESCQKSWCKLGCVCKSLACASRIPIHCGKVECMFECKCSIGDISLEGSSLSSDAVFRLEDQAKRNLAKVEKEFTQTVIHTNDRSILIPSSDRNKTKRTKRMPKRYSDYFEDSNFSNNIQEEKELPNCLVELKKLEIKDVVPLCLYHDLYNCPCISKEETISIPLPETENPENVQTKTKKIDSQEPAQSKPKKKKLSIEKKKSTKELKEADVPMIEGNDSDSDYMEELKIVDNRKTKDKSDCARLSGVPAEFLARNEIPFYKNKQKAKARQAERAIHFDFVNAPDFGYTEYDTTNIDVVTPFDILACDRLKLFLGGKLPLKRKQVFDENLQNSPKRLKTDIDNATSNNCVEGEVNNDTLYVKKDENQPCVSVFDGEIIVPTIENKDFVKKLGVKSAAPYMRLLPWIDLLRNYYMKKINIWCPNNSNKNMLLNLSTKRAPPGYIEITESKRKNGIMNWILSKQLPKNTPPHLVHLILSPKNNYFEISGICLKNITEEQKGKRLLKEESDAEKEMFTHKNHTNESNTLAMIKKRYPCQEFHEWPSKDQTCAFYLALPPIESLRWRMVFLNSNFTFLRFLKNNYSIKYTDLMNIVKQSQDANKTICLSSHKMKEGFKNPQYGIYAVPKTVHVLFIGPYEMNEEHNLQTLRYLKQELVPTEYFEQVQGCSIPNKRSDIWLISKQYFNVLSSRISKNSLHVHTKSSKEDSEYAVLTPLPSTSNNTYLKQAEELRNLNSQFLDASGNFITSMELESRPVIKCPDFLILNGKKFRPEDYNCFLVTNIPRFGYLGALKSATSVEIDWPFGNKILRFASKATALDFVRRRFSNLLLPVPSSFILKTAFVDDLNDLKSLTKVDSRVLNGTHMCGTFGVLDSRKLTAEVAASLGTTQEEVLQRLAKRAQYLGHMEIEKLKAQEKVLVEQKKALIVKKQHHLKRYMELLLDLPEEVKQREYANLLKRLERGDTETADGDASTAGVECIEIDSDSEEFTESVESTAAMQANAAVKTIPRPEVSPHLTEGPTSSSDNEASKSVENFKLVKTSSGKMVLIKGNSGVSLSRSLTGMKLKIKNNKVVEQNALT